MKRIVVTGATSMLGIALIEKCIEEQIKILAIVREDSIRQDSLPQSELVTVVKCNLSKLHELRQLGHTYDAFYHFAWEGTSGNSRNNVAMQERNIAYTLDAVRLASDIGCTKFIGAGSQAEYGRVTGVISPDSKVSPDTAYGVAKLAAGKMAMMLAADLGIDCIWPRVFSVYGLRDLPTTMIMYCIASLLNKEIPQLTKCEQQWDYLNCRDAANAFYLIGEKGKAGSIYNIGSGRTQPLAEYVYAIRDAIDMSLPLGIGAKEYQKNQVMHLCPDISNLQKDTGFCPNIPFRNGVIETISWYREKNHLC